MFIGLQGNGEGGSRQNETPITASDLAVSLRCAFVLHSGDVSVLSPAPGWPFGELRENWTTLAAEGNFRRIAPLV